MKKDPAVLFYTSDFLSETFTMTNEQVGMYIRLLCIQHQKEKLTEKDMLSVCPSRDEDVWGKFSLENGVYLNQRMSEEAERRKNFTESRRKNIKNRYSKSTYVEDMKNTSSSYEEHMNIHMETGTETETRTVTKTKKVSIPFSENFVQYWNQWKEYKSKEHKFNYKTQISEQSALDNLQKLSNGHEQTAIAIIDQSIINGWKGFFAIKSVKASKHSNGAYQLLEELRHDHEASIRSQAGNLDY
jgi:uncharacterized protein YdaU (DUF1376 family)